MSMWALDRGVHMSDAKFSPEGKWCKKVFNLWFATEKAVQKQKHHLFLIFF